MEEQPRSEPISITQFVLVQTDDNNFKVYLSEKSLQNEHPELNFQSCKVNNKVARLINKPFELIEPTLYVKVRKMSNAMAFDFSDKKLDEFVPVEVVS